MNSDCPWEPHSHQEPLFFQTKGCMNCHALHGVGGKFGPELDTIGRKLSVEQIERYILNPKSVNPNAKMPAQGGLSDRERDEVAKFLGNLK